jgi:hypothetical protein
MSGAVKKSRKREEKKYKECESESEFSQKCETKNSL